MTRANRKENPPAEPKRLSVSEAAIAMVRQDGRLETIADYAHAIGLCVIGMEAVGNGERDASAVNLLTRQIEKQAAKVQKAGDCVLGTLKSLEAQAMKQQLGGDK